jgi:signal transduction histidine kinase
LAHTVHRSGTALLDIINNILDFSKIEAGKLELEEIAFSVRQIIEETVELLAEPAARKGLELNCLIAADVPDRLRGDPIRLRQILLNLVSNAVKFTSQGEVTIRVTLSSQAPSSVTIKCAVADMGIGILPSAQERLFAAFSQADGSMTRRFGGTGLGLAIVKTPGPSHGRRSRPCQFIRSRFDVLVYSPPRPRTGIFGRVIGTARLASRTDPDR